MVIEGEYLKESIKKLCKLSVLLNLLTITFGIVYFIIPTYNFFYDIFGIILISSWLINISLLYIDDKHLVKNSSIGKSINRFLFYYIIFFIVGILLIVSGVVILTIIIEGDSFFLGMIIVYIDILTGLLGIAVLGIYLAWITLINLDEKEVWTYE